MRGCCSWLPRSSELPFLERDRMAAAGIALRHGPCRTRLPSKPMADAESKLLMQGLGALSNFELGKPRIPQHTPTLCRKTLPELAPEKNDWAMIGQTWADPEPESQPSCSLPMLSQLPTHRAPRAGALQSPSGKVCNLIAHTSAVCSKLSRQNKLNGSMDMMGGWVGVPGCACPTPCRRFEEAGQLTD